MPLHWQHGGQHDDRLPRQLRNTANDVLRVFELNEYSLHLMHDKDVLGPRGRLWPDLEQAGQMRFGSAFVALASALLMLEEGIRHPNLARNHDHLTVSSGRWEEGSGICAVGGVKRKTRAVAEFPRKSAPCIRNWFLPAHNVSEATETLEEMGSQVLLQSLPASNANPRRALARLLAVSGVRPGPDADLNALTAYYEFLRAWDTDKADKYYNEELFDQVIDRCVVDQRAFVARPKCLISVVSSPALIGIATNLFRPENVLILFTEGDPADRQRGQNVSEYADRANQAEKMVTKAGANPIKSGFVFQPQLSGRNLQASVTRNMMAQVHDILERFPAGQLMWDVTSGLRVFTLAMHNRLARHGDWMLCLSHVWSGQRNHRIPLTESVLLWRHGHDAWEE